MQNPSLSTPPGSFSNIDSIHVHVDGGGASAPVENIVKQLMDQGSPGKTTPIKEAVSGPQREETWAVGTYESHTPGPAGKEHLEFFSTSMLSDNLDDRQVAIRRLSQILKMLFEEQSNLPEGIVVEVERVIGRGEDQIVWSEIAVDDTFVIHSPDAGFERSRTAEIEIHYAFDIPKIGKWEKIPPITLKELKNHCNALEIYVGGWFFFEKAEKWAYRSNQFARSVEQKKIQDQRDKLNKFLAGMGQQKEFQSTARALVEQVLGVWRTPLRVVDKDLKKTTRELAQWECSRDLEEFWVIAPNFLGDTRGDVRQAMVANLKNRVSYTYFLRSFADVQRLRKLAETLEPEVQGYADIYDLLRAVLLESTGFGRDIFSEEYFIAHVSPEMRDGYRLLRNRKGLVYGGEKMKAADFRKADRLKDMITQNQVTQWIQIPLRRDTERPKQNCLVCVEFNGMLDGKRALNEAEWDAVREDFDQMVADNVSKFYGQVVKASTASYFIVFESAEFALECASSLQRDVRDHNKRQSSYLTPPRIAVDFGLIKRVLQSYGFDLSGYPISISTKLVTQIDDGKILLTKSVEEHLSSQLRNQFKMSDLSPKAIEEFDSVECRELDWE